MFLMAILVLIIFSEEGGCQIFTRTCQDPLVQNHQNVFGHTFCYHSCGYELNIPNPVGLEVCTGSGICQCNYQCDTAAPATTFGDQCPSYASDPPDTDPTAVARCSLSCAGLCAGGQGMICGEVYETGLGPNQDIWAKICTCYCPPQPCTTTTTSTSTTTTTTIPTTIVTTTPAPDMTTAIALFPFPVYLPFIKKKLKGGWKLLGIKAVIKCILIIKLIGIYLLKAVLFSIFLHKYLPSEKESFYGWERF